MGALLRSALVLLAIAIPSFFLPEMSQTTGDFTTVIALIFALLIFIEYAFSAPSFIEFRFTPPYNRIRFLCFVVLLYSLSQIQSLAWNTSDMTRVIGGLSRVSYVIWDFPFSPIHAVEFAITKEASICGPPIGPQASFAFTLSILGFAVFCISTFMFTRPLRDTDFNLWINLPTFSSSHMDNPIGRLRLLASMCILLAITLPFFLPVFLNTVGSQIGIEIGDSNRLVMWFLVFWAWIPFALLMRATAFFGVARHISKKKKIA
jgi:hypothetical protein